MLTPQSRIREAQQNPVGSDMLERVLSALKLPPNALDNPLIGGLKLSYLPRLTGGRVDEGFLQAFCRLCNTAADEPILAPVAACKPAWWKEAVFYQIYPRSFRDSNADGMGDLQGIREKLPYLKELGVTALWLSPIYDSPWDDGGYDIRDYQRLLPAFGTMEDFDALLRDAHALDMKLIMDLVLNHSSDEHEWYQKALNDPDSPERGYYFFRDRPNNWASFFSGSAWNETPDGQHSLHLFSKKQPDLNWENPELRQKLYDMVNWWLRKGVDGFRMDVINFISKNLEPDGSLPDGNELLGQFGGFTGVEHYLHGPRLHRYLREFRDATFGNYDACTVGETGGTGVQVARLLTHDNRGELNMVFSFDHLENPGKGKFDDYAYDLLPLRDVLVRWQTGMDTWNTLFFENHDNPRMVSKILPDPKSPYFSQVSKLLLTLQCTLRGTPFLYQGQEFGSRNRVFSAPEEFEDVESINYYQELLNTMSPEKALKRVAKGSRDHARQPMPWDSIDDGEGSVLAFCKAVIALRQAQKALIYGDFEVLPAGRSLFCYHRTLGGERYLIELNLTDREQPARTRPAGAALKLSNYPEAADRFRPYEANVYECPV